MVTESIYTILLLKNFIEPTFVGVTITDRWHFFTFETDIFKSKIKNLRGSSFLLAGRWVEEIYIVVTEKIRRTNNSDGLTSHPQNIHWTISVAMVQFWLSLTSVINYTARTDSACETILFRLLIDETGWEIMLIVNLFQKQLCQNKKWNNRIVLLGDEMKRRF